ncbi:MAG: nucleotide sugar dehydrogenase, partial [Chloroflexus sp.]
MVHELMNRIHGRSAKVGVIGLGYVGLPLAERAGRAGFAVLGFDVSAERVAQINRGESYIGDVASDALVALRERNLIEATTDMHRMRECDILVICVPTPLHPTREPDMRYIEAASENVAASIRPGQLVILESTTYPGTTRELILPRIERNGLRVGEQIFLAFSPERIDPGQTSSQGFSVENTPKVVGGVTAHCTELASAFYGYITSRVVPV